MAEHLLVDAPGSRGHVANFHPMPLASQMVSRRQTG